MVELHDGHGKLQCRFGNVALAAKVMSPSNSQVGGCGPGHQKEME